MNRFLHPLAASCLALLLTACAGGQVRAQADAASSMVGAPAAAMAGADAPVALAEPSADAATPPAAMAAAADADAAPQADRAKLEQARPTQAEYDFAALYGNGEPYDPVADARLPDPAQLSIAYDPWEPFNRRMHAFNEVVDRRIALPLARAYVAAVPRPIRQGVGNMFVNLGQPVSALNALLQGQPTHAAAALARFLINITAGIGGLFDPATHIGLPLRSEDFGQTLGVWGWERSRYLELPLFGPRTLRDVFGMAGDAPLAPLQYVQHDPTRVVLQSMQLVDIRTNLMSVDSMREGAADGYALMRDAWIQRRNYQIHGDRRSNRDETLPDYLREDDLPMVPLDAIPVHLPGNP